MPFRVFASAAILEAQMGSDAGFAKSAHRAVFNYTPREGYLYVRSRAISSRCNDNFDMFPAEEIEKSYLTFIGKPVFVNHHNEDHRRARGVIIDAALHKDRNPDGSPDTWSEVLMEVDAVRFPRLAKAILAGEVDRTSMGCDVQLSKCSVCGNEATSPLQYCAHIPGKKGKKVYKIDPRTGAKSAQLVFEICSGLSFFENSLLVEAPADPTAFFLGNVEVGPGLEHLTAGMNKTAAFHPASPTGLNEAYHVHETNETDGYDSGFTPGDKGIDVHDYPRAIGELRNNWQIHDDNLQDEYNPDKKRDSLRRREVGKLINSLEDHHRKQGAVHPYAWNVDGRTTPYTYQEGAEYQRQNFQTKTMYDAQLLNVWALLKQAAAPTIDHDQDYRLIGENEARGDSRPVSEEEFHEIAQRGRRRYNAMTRNKQSTQGLEDNWDSVKHHAYQSTREPWGGATYNTRTGLPIKSDADIYAMTVRPTGEHHPISVPVDAPEHEFHAAMDHARSKYADHLANRGHHLGVFHDADEGRIDIDPVTLLDNQKQVEEIGAYKGSVGGAYHFKSGNGFWPPHVKGLHTTARKTAATEPHYSAAADGVQNDHVRGFEGRDVPDSGHPVSVYRDLSGAPKSGYPARGSWSIKRQRKNGSPDAHVVAHTVGLHVTNAKPQFYEAARQHFKEQEKRGVHAFINGNVSHYTHPLEAGEKPEGEGWRQVSYYPDISHFFMKDTRNKFHGSDEAAFRGGSMWARGNIQEGEDGPVPQSKFEQPRTGKIWEFIHEASVSGDDLYDWDFLAARANHPEAHLAGQQHWPAMAPIVGSRPGMKDSDVEWFKKHPASSQNIVDHYHQATDQEKDEGARWYSEVGHGGQVLAKAHNPHLSDEEARHQGAGVISAFSPQSEFHSNMLNAMTTFHHGEAPASARKKSSASPADAEAHMAMESNSVNADKIVKGAHPTEVLGGHKTHCFYHNLAHGGQESADAKCACPNDHVTVDAHALSVACGKRIRAKEHGNPDMSDYHTYHHVADMYRDATHQISQHEGRDVHPSEVQAVTWLVRQRLNGDKAQTTKSNNTKKVLHERMQQRGFDPEEIMGGSKSNHQPKSSRLYVAYGETKSPEDVDTLRSENCTVCGNSSAWDGTQCQVCGYTAPPRPFGDPNTDIAQQKDIRKQVLDGNEADPNDPNQQLGQQLGDPDELQDQQDAAAAGEDTQMGPLTCNVCGTGVQPAPPTSDTGGEPPYPADGDVCPICQKGQLLSGAEGGAPMGDEAEMDSADAEEGQEGNAPGGASQQQAEEDDGDQDENDEEEGRSDASDDDDQDDGDSFDPKQKADKNQKKSAFVPVWWKPVWWRG